MYVGTKRRRKELKCADRASNITCEERAIRSKYSPLILLRVRQANFGARDIAEDPSNGAANITHVKEITIKSAT